MLLRFTKMHGLGNDFVVIDARKAPLALSAGEAARIADRAVIYPDRTPRFNLDRTIDRIVTSRLWGFPLMLALFTLVFWITITGANYPSQMLSDLLIGRVHPLLKAGAAAIHMP